MAPISGSGSDSDTSQPSEPTPSQPGSSQQPEADAAERTKAAGRLLGQALSGATRVVGDTHAAMSRRVRPLLPEQGQQVGDVVDLMGQGIYSIVGSATAITPIAAAEVYTRLAESQQLVDSPRGQTLLTAVSGIWGDTIATEHPSLAIPTTVRRDGADVALEAQALEQAFPDASDSLVVFIHGLSQGEECWWREPGTDTESNADPDREGVVSYGQRLESDFGYTPVYVRYNSGLRISESGRGLDELLSQLVRQWPVAVREIRLVGYSMGGLVARSACHHNAGSAPGWSALVHTVVTLGTPHHGSHLEKSVNVADWLLAKTPETAPLSRLLRSRSGGVKDLRYGAVVDEDVNDLDPDEFLTDRGNEVPFLPHAAYYFVASTITSDTAHPAGRMFGDGLVRYPSSSGKGTNGRVHFEDNNGAHLGGVGHLALTNNPAVYALLREWLRPG